MIKANGLPEFLNLTDRMPEISEMAEIALLWAVTKNPELGRFPRTELVQYVQEILDNIAKFHETAKEAQPVSPDTDIIFVLSGSGTYNRVLSDITIDDVYKPYPWALATDFQRLDKAAKIIKKITSDKMGIPLDQVRQDNISELGPILVYNGRPPHIQALKEALEGGRFDLPLDKVKILETVRDDDGIARPYINTIDQFKGFRQSQSFHSNPKQMLLLSHDAHLVRALYIMGQYCILPETTILQAYPLPTASWGVIEHAILEVSGILYYSLITNDAAKKPHPYQIFN